MFEVVLTAYSSYTIRTILEVHHRRGDPSNALELEFLPGEEKVRCAEWK